MNMRKFFLILVSASITIALLLPNGAYGQDENPPEEPSAETPEPTREDTPKELETFVDVLPGSSYFVAVNFLREKRIVRGYGDGTFRPNQVVNRVEALSIIFNSAKNLPSQELEQVQQFTLPIDTVLNLSFPTETDITLQTPSMETPITLERTGILELILPQGGILRAGRIFLNQEPVFTDVQPSQWYFPLIKRGISLDVIKGYPDGRFMPENPVSLVEALAMLLRTNRIPLSESSWEKFPEDVHEDVWYRPYVAYALERTIVVPEPGNKIHPGEALTRGDIANLIHRFLRNQEGVQFGKASWYKDGASKIKVPANETFVEQNQTAAHRTLAFGTVVRVTNLANGKIVDVVINDRGPFVPGRIIDLSRTAFSALETTSVGVINVQIKVLIQP